MDAQERISGGRARSRNLQQRPLVTSHSIGSSEAQANSAKRLRSDPAEFPQMQLPQPWPYPPPANKRGTAGIPRTLRSNFFEFQVKGGAVFCMYAVKFDERVETFYMKKALMRFKQDELGGQTLFDGKMLFTTEQIPMHLHTFHVGFPERQEEQYLVEIEFIRFCDHFEPVSLQKYNILIRKCQSMIGLDLIGRHFYDKEARIDLGSHKLELWPGFITSIRQHETKVLLKVDTTFKVLRKDDVFVLMKEIRQKYENNPNFYKDRIALALIGTTVMTMYNQKTYRIDAIDWQLRPIDEFECIKNGISSQISYIDYYQEKGVIIKFPNQPMLISRPTARDIKRGDTGDKILIPEMCHQCGLSPEMRENFSLMKAVSNYLLASPEARFEAIQRFVDRLIESNEVRDHLLHWNARLRREPIQVDGRVLPPQEIVFQTQQNNNGNYNAGPQAEWSHAFRSNRMLSSAVLERWAIIALQREAGNLENLVSTLQRVAKPMGYRIERPQIVRTHDQQPLTFRDAIHKLMRDSNGRIQLIMIVLPSKGKELYAAVKMACAVDCGVLSQCLVSKTLNNSKSLMSVCTKVVVQMNAKQGGQPWSVKNPLKGIMVVGYHIYKEVGKSFGAMVASTSDSLARYYSTLTEEGVSGNECMVGPAFKRCLHNFRLMNNCLPHRIFFYRNGVCDGMVILLLQAEIESLKKEIKNMYPDSELPKFTFILVTRGQSVRFFDVRETIQNPLPGTVVDNTVTFPERYDFYLIAQNARQGSVSPTTYTVLMDTSGLTPDHIQIFTYKLCHLYFNWSGTIPVPAPCRYAQTLAMVSGKVLGGTSAKSELNDKLHFL